MFDNTLVLDPSGQLPGIPITTTKSYDRVSQAADTPNGSVWRVPGTALSLPDVLVIKHAMRKGKGSNIQASSIKHTMVQNDTVTGQKVPFEVGIYSNMPNGSFASAPELIISNMIAYLLGLVRQPNTRSKLLNAEG